jgi:polyhydroxyalkanoate synthesis regulator phasin
MAETNVLKKYLDAGVSFTNLTQAKAEALVKELVKVGEVQTEQAQAAVLDLLERSKKNTEALIEQIRKEISESAESLGLATIADITRLEKLIASIKIPGTGAAAPQAPAAPAAAPAPAVKKAPAKKAAAKKAPAKKAAAKKAPAKKAAAKKSAS